MVPLQIWVKNLEEKREIRNRILALRSQMPAQAWEEKTRAITARVLSHPWFQETETIYSYVDVRGETGTRRIIEEAWKKGKRVAVPRTRGEEMEFYYIQSWDELKCGRFQIPEPENGEQAEGRKGLVLMPGAVFDEQLSRIGYGGGFYDRYLEKHPHLHRMALAFECQVLPEIPTKPHDVCPEILMTETKIRSVRRDGNSSAQRPDADAQCGEH